MLDHFHVIINPMNSDPSKWLLRTRGNSARLIMDTVRAGNSHLHINYLRLSSPQKRSHTHAVWQKDPLAVDLESRKFIRQKIAYVQANPVRANYVDHPAKWRWSSFHAYFPHKPGDVPIEIDQRPYWTDAELNEYWSARR